MGTKKQGTTPFSGKMGNKKSREIRIILDFSAVFIIKLIAHRKQV